MRAGKTGMKARFFVCAINTLIRPSPKNDPREEKKKLSNGSKREEEESNLGFFVFVWPSGLDGRAVGPFKSNVLFYYILLP